MILDIIVLYIQIKVYEIHSRVFKNCVCLSERLKKLQSDYTPMMFLQTYHFYILKLHDIFDKNISQCKYT